MRRFGAGKVNSQPDKVRPMTQSKMYIRHRSRLKLFDMPSGSAIASTLVMVISKIWCPIVAQRLAWKQFDCCAINLDRSMLNDWEKLPRLWWHVHHWWDVREDLSKAILPLESGWSGCWSCWCILTEAAWWGSCKALLQATLEEAQEWTT